VAAAQRSIGAPIAVLFLLANAFVWGVSWWPFRYLEKTGLHPLWSTLIIYLVACIGISLWRPQSFKQLWQRPHLIWLMLGSGITNASFNWAVTVGDVVRVVLLFYLMPIWSALLARWLLAEPIRLNAVLRMILAIVGAVLVLGQGEKGIPLPSSLADYLAILGGMSFALNNVMLRKYAHEPDNVRAFAMFAGGVVCAGFIGLFLWLQLKIPSVPLQQFNWVWPAIGLALAFIAANICLQWGAANLAASTTAIVMLSEILFAAVSSVVAGVAQTNWSLWLGGSLIVAASLIAVLESKKP
jgi:drug/metabolite transporter (DMT)-like permease